MYVDVQVDFYEWLPMTLAPRVTSSSVSTCGIGECDELSLMIMLCYVSRDTSSEWA